MQVHVHVDVDKFTMEITHVLRLKGFISAEVQKSNVYMLHPSSLLYMCLNKKSSLFESIYKSIFNTSFFNRAIPFCSISKWKPDGCDGYDRHNSHWVSRTHYLTCSNCYENGTRQFTLFWWLQVSNFSWDQEPVRVVLLLVLTKPHASRAFLASLMAWRHSYVIF